MGIGEDMRQAEEDRLVDARVRQIRTHDKAKAAHQRAAVNHTQAAEHWEGIADGARERGDDAAANDAERRARVQHELARREVDSAEIEQQRLRATVRPWL